MSMSLPINIPWKIIAVLPEMMDTQFCNKQFPFNWRTSLAISAYEPKLEDMPTEFCNERITYLKITCSITGYQPSREEVNDGYAKFPNVSQETLDKIFSQYLACYGVLLNVAVFPYNTEKILKRVSIDFSQLPFTPSGNKKLPNPYVSKQNVRFEATSVHENFLVDYDSDQKGELFLHQEMVIFLPSTTKVEAKMYLQSKAIVKMDAYKGETLVGTKNSGRPRKGYRILLIDGEGIDKVVIKTERDESSLLEFVYYALIEEEVPIENIKEYPHIIDFEPKVRDYYQSATQTGEVLTASHSGLKLDKSNSNTKSTETGISAEAKVGNDYTSPWTAKVSASTQWGKSSTDSTSTQTETSRDIRETTGMTTQLNQLYNMLTGYHAGTNRAVFLLLPRLNILQVPANQRTFIRGLRIIEGIQDFFLVVSRPKHIEGLNIEAQLETSHIPELPEQQQTTKPILSAELPITRIDEFKFCDGFHALTAPTGERDVEFTYNAPPPYIIDDRGGAGGFEAIEFQSTNHPDDFKTEVAPDKKSLKVSGKLKKADIKAQGWYRWDLGILHGKYKIYLILENLPTSETSPKTQQIPLITTLRELCTRYTSVDNQSIIKSSLTAENNIDNNKWDSIVDETTLHVGSEFSISNATDNETIIQSQQLALKEVLKNIEYTVTTSWKLPRRRPIGTVGFLDSDYFKSQIQNYLPLGFPINNIPNLSQQVKNSFPPEYTIGQVLTLDLHVFRRRTGLSITDAKRERQIIMQYNPPQPDFSNNKQENKFK
jgi:hypothetical protein